MGGGDMNDENGKGTADCGCGSGDCCSGGKPGWRGRLGMILTIVILAAAGLVIARGLLSGAEDRAEGTAPAGEGG